MGSQHVACSMVGTTSDSVNTWPECTHLRAFPYSQKSLLDPFMLNYQLLSRQYQQHPVEKGGAFRGHIGSYHMADTNSASSNGWLDWTRWRAFHHSQRSWLDKGHLVWRPAHELNHWGDGDLQGQAHLDSHHSAALSADPWIVHGSRSYPGCNL